MGVVEGFVMSCCLLLCHYHLLFYYNSSCAATLRVGPCKVMGNRQHTSNTTLVGRRVNTLLFTEVVVTLQDWQLKYCSKSLMVCYTFALQIATHQSYKC